ncbi:MAG: hypothetical protein KDJ52_24800 [Anaerolineae bacterium]|nr:hypothetical protein [Anaerolineae bacterium]
MRSLRTRLIISHILPLLVVVPLVGIVLLYIVETQISLGNITAELEEQAVLTAQMAAEQPEMWLDAHQAQIFVSHYSTYHRAKVTLIDPEGKLIASNDPNDADQLGRPLNVPNLSNALAGDSSTQTNFILNSKTEVVEVLMPVTAPNREVLGVVRLTNDLADMSVRFQRLRTLILSVLAVELLVGIGIGLLLALSLERSLKGVTEAIYGVATGRSWETLPERGPHEVRLLLRSFNSLIERLRLMEETRRRLLANIVHEVGRPIGALQSAIQALINGADRDEALRRELLDGMEAEVERLHPLLDDLAKLHDQILGTLELDCRAIKLNQWLMPVLIPWREAAQAKDLEWHTDVPLTLPTLEIDPDRLAQVLGNLLSNAIKYTPAGGSVRVSAGSDAEAVWLRVSDTGPGLSQEEQKQIFEPFYRSQRSHRFPQGMGLGLTIALDLVVAHGGRLEVESEPEQGSRFTVWLPRNKINSLT